jgi:hypothetical protein
VFWIGWVDGATRGLGEVALVGALLGFAVLRAPVTRAATTGMMVGYLLFSVLFARHIFQNDYYHAQAIPLVAVLLGHLVSEFAGIVRRAQVPRWASVTGVFAALAVTSILELLALRAVLVPERKPTVPQAVADEVGALVGHSDRVVFVATYYGWPLVYKAELAGTYWPRSTAAPMFSRGDPAPLTVQERIAALPFEPEYFAVTDLEDYARNHADLADFLDTHCAERRERAAYRVYSSCEPGVP